MKRPDLKAFFQESLSAFKGSGSGRNAFRGGGYAMVITAIVLAIVLLVNVAVSALPTNLTQFDMSASKLYSITSNTKAVVNNLEDDVTIYWIVQADEEDAIIEALLDKYDSLSDHISVEKKNPDVYPTFAEQYTDEDVANNSLVVECGDRSRYIAYEDIYVTDADLYSYSYTTSFDGEGAITSAIDYVVTDELPQLYVLGGHGEQELPQTFADQITKENIETTQFSLLTNDSVPEKADAVLIYEPQSDISEKEKTKLADYGVTTVDGVVVEASTDHYTAQPYILLPDMQQDGITDALIQENYYPNMPIAQGLVVSEDADNVVEVLTTSDEAFSKAAGYDLATYEKEDGDTDGPFALAVSIACENEGQIVWFSSAAYLEDMYNALSSGANVDMTMNAVSELIGEREAMAIRSKSLNYNYLSISGSTATLLKVLMVGGFPLAYLGTGTAVILKRRRAQHEAD